MDLPATMTTDQAKVHLSTDSPSANDAFFLKYPSMRHLGYNQDASKKCFKSISALLSKVADNGMKLESILLKAMINMKLEETWNVVHKMVDSGLQPDVVTYSRMLITVRHTKLKGNMTKALRFLYRMKELGVHPNAVVFNSLIKGYLDITKTKVVDEASSALTLMEEFGIKPNAVTFSNIMNAWSSAGLMDNCEDQYQVVTLLALSLTVAEQRQYFVEICLLPCHYTMLMSSGGKTADITHGL
ncbi:hypothetical protein Fmac_003812 [Flemingia macrophylla]|uniref:Pentatricopeptide repeat-containing protein n=1 Tax=Flemingia macrophylla TaxID=520843 RepID=A0ABD1N405_9FABA